VSRRAIIAAAYAPGEIALRKYVTRKYNNMNIYKFARRQAGFTRSRGTQILADINLE